MQRIIALLFFLFALQGCHTSDELVFPVEKSFKDSGETLAFIQKELLSTADGWLATHKLNQGGMFTLYCQFQSDGKVTMAADIDYASTTTPSTSNYQLDINQNKVRVTFKNGSHLDLQSTAGRHVQGDKQFTFQHNNDNSLHFLGDKYGDELVLKKATAIEHSVFEDESMLLNIYDMVGFMVQSRYYYVEPEAGKKVQISLLPKARGAFFLYVSNDFKIIGSDFAYTPTGLLFREPIHIFGELIQECTWDKTNEKFYITYKAERFYLEPAELSVVPLHYQLGTEIPYPTRIRFWNPNEGRKSGWSDEFMAGWDLDQERLFDNLATYPRLLQFNINTEDTITLYVATSLSPNPDDWKITTLQYTYKKSQEGIFSFSLLPIIGDSPDAQLARDLIKNMPNVLGLIASKNFTLNFYNSEYGILAQFQCVENPSLTFAGQIIAQ